MELIEYPNAIAEAQKLAVDAREYVRMATGALEACKARIAVEISEDKSLTNADKRKAARLEIEATDPEYQSCMAELLKHSQVLALAEIEAQRLQNLFKAERILAA